MDAHAPLAQKKVSDPQKKDPRWEFQSFLIRLSLVQGFTFLRPGSRSGLSPLGKRAAQAWLDLGSGGIRADAVVFRAGELEGVIFMPASPNVERKLGLAMRLLKTRIAREAGKIGNSTVGIWKKSHQAKPMASLREITAAKKRILGEAMLN